MTGMNDENQSGLITILDEEGTEHKFELLDAIETDDGRYVALLPVYQDPSDMVDGDGELIILSVEEEDGEGCDGEDTLATIEDEKLFDEIAEIFEERLSDLYEIEDV